MFIMWDGETWTRFVWLWTGTGEGACECGNELSGSIKFDKFLDKLRTS